MLPVIALVGRPNVGKSTLFNHLTCTRDALVSSFSGLTRDRKYGCFEKKGCEFICIDTAGINYTGEGVTISMVKQSLLAIKEADIILFIVDASTGVMSSDVKIAKYLRSCRKRIFVIANKIDEIGVNLSIDNFRSLGLGEVYPMSFSKKCGISNFIKKLLLPIVHETKILSVTSGNAKQSEKYESNKIEVIYNAYSKNTSIKLAIVGRPNVGKSTLINCILGEERMVICEYPGTTRDSIYVPVRFNNREYLLIDTAGVRKQTKIIEEMEKFSVMRTFKEIEEANVVVLVIDAYIGISNQDLSILNFILKSGRSFVIAVNKWDNISYTAKKQIKKTLDYRLDFVKFYRIHFISALYGKGIDKLLTFIREAYDNSIRSITSRTLTRTMMMAIMEHKPPLVRGRKRVKMRYAHSVGNNPFTVMIYGNQVKDIQDSYKQYLINYFHKKLKIIGSPIKIKFKESKIYSLR